jgi:hypothetical protein
VHAPIRLSERAVKEHTMVGTVGKISLSLEGAHWCTGLTECAKGEAL